MSASPGSAVRLEATREPATDRSALQVFAGATGTAFGSAGPRVDRRFEGLSVSASRDRVITLESREDEQQVVVRDAGGATVAVVAVQPLSGGDGFRGATTFLSGTPALSPDGTVAVWRRVTFDGCAITDSRLLSRDVAGGAVRVLSATKDTGLTDPVFTGDLMVLAQEEPDGQADGCTYTLAKGYEARTSAGATVPVKGLAAVFGPEFDVTTYRDLSFSPDGSRVAYARYEVGDFFDQQPVAVEVAPVTRTADALTIGTPIDLGEGEAPEWSADGSRVLFVREGDTLSAPATGGPVTVLRSDPKVSTTEFTQVVHERQAPAAPSSSATRSNTATALRFAVPQDATASLVRITRTAPGAAPVARTVALPATSFTDTGLVKARSYTYAVQVQDRSGNLSPALTVQAPSTLPASAVRVSGQALDPGQQITAANGVSLRLGRDGNLVVRSPSGTPLWQSATRAGGGQLRVQGDGNVVLYNARRQAVWQSGSAGEGSVALVVQPDGNVVAYRDRDGRAVWQTRTS